MAKVMKAIRVASTAKKTLTVKKAPTTKTSTTKTPKTATTKTTSSTKKATSTTKKTTSATKKEKAVKPVKLISLNDHIKKGELTPTYNDYIKKGKLTPEEGKKFVEICEQLPRKGGTPKNPELKGYIEEVLGDIKNGFLSDKTVKRLGEELEETFRTEVVYAVKKGDAKRIAENVNLIKEAKHYKSMLRGYVTSVLEGYRGSWQKFIG